MQEECIIYGRTSIIANGLGWSRPKSKVSTRPATAQAFTPHGARSQARRCRRVRGVPADAPLKQDVRRQGAGVLGKQLGNSRIASSATLDDSTQVTEREEVCSSWL